MVGTNSIRQNYSREGGLDYIVGHGGKIMDAVSTQVWSGDAAVYVSIVNWLKGDLSPAELATPRKLVVQRGDRVESPWETYEFAKINAALSPGLDVTDALHLSANRKPKR